MASLYIDFGYDDNVKRSINSAKRAINSRISDYNGIINSVNNTRSETSNLWNANVYIKKKRDKLQTKWDKLDRFHTKISDFNEYASDKDKAVADRIKEETNRFYKRENIKTGFLYTVGCVVSDGWKWIKGAAETVWDAVCTGAKVVWKTIKKFYEDHKYLINLVVDTLIVIAEVALLIAAVAATGGIAAPALVFGIWGIADAFTDACFSAAAYGAHLAGKDDMAEKLSGKGLKDVAEHYLGDFGVLLYTGMEIASFAYDVTEFAERIGKVGKAGKKLWLSRNADGVLNDDFVRCTRKNSIKEGIKFLVEDCIGIKYTKSKGMNVLSNTKTALKQFKNWTDSSEDSSVATKILKTFSITGKGYSFIKNRKSYDDAKRSILKDVFTFVTQPLFRYVVS